MSYPIVQTGSLTLPSGVIMMKISQVQVQKQTPLFNVAGSGNTHAEFVRGIETNEYIGQGFINLSGTTYGLSQSSTLAPTTPTDLEVKAQSWRLRRNWRLFDVTGSGDSEKEWSHGLPSTSLSVSGVAETGYVATHSATSINVTTVMDQVGTLTGTLKMPQKVDVLSYGAGGVPTVQYSGSFSEQPTFTEIVGADNDLNWLLGSSVTAPAEGTLTVDMGDSANLTPNVLVYDVSLSCLPRDGGAIRVTARMRQNKA